MIIAPVRAALTFTDGRLDAKYYCSPGVMASQRMQLLAASGAKLRPVAGKDGMGSVEPTSRTKRVYAASGEESVPYLRPYDVFDYLPRPADMLSKSASVGIDRLMPEPGTILQTCSGRNLGPLAYADEYISRFAVSDDMLRLHIENDVERLYTLAFLSTPTGQALLTRNKTGNVIDHLSTDDLSSIPVPFIDESTTGAVANKMREAIARRENARIRLNTLIEKFVGTLPGLTRDRRMRDGWTQRAANLSDRLDAAFYDPLVVGIRAAMETACGVRVGDVANISVPDWYTRHYVTADHGRCIVSGRQLLQTKPVNLRYIATRSLEYSAYELKEGTIAFGSRGRAEERMSLPALITTERASWLASENVIRVRPRQGVNPGWLYLCFACWQVQAQVQASTHGAVVDVIDPRRLDKVLLPPPNNECDEPALECWRDFEKANASEAEAVAEVQTVVLQASASLPNSDRH